MAVQFEQILSLKLPGVYVETRPGARRGLSDAPHRVLLVGTRLSAGTKADAELFQVLDPDQGVVDAGDGSMLADMIRKFKGVSHLIEVWAVGLDEDAGGTASTKTVTFGAASTAPGTISWLIGGKRLNQSVPSGTSASDQGDDFVTLVTANPDLPFTAVNVAGVVTCTNKYKGVGGSSVNVQHSYYSGERLPTGVAITIADVIAGAGNPDLSDAVAAAAGMHFHTWCVGWSDGANMTILDTELTARADGNVGEPSRALIGVHGTYAEYTAAVSAQDSEFLCMVPQLDDGPNSPWEVAAVAAAVDAKQTIVDAARPRHGLTVTGILPPKAGGWTQGEKELMYPLGGTLFGTENGAVQIQRLRTTYKTNALAISDDSQADMTTVRNLDYVRFQLRQRLGLTYPRHKLALDGTNFAPGQAVATPSAIRGTILALFKELEFNGAVQDYETFKDELVVEIDGTDPNRVNILAGPNLIKALRVTAVALQFT